MARLDRDGERPAPGAEEATSILTRAAEDAQLEGFVVQPLVLQAPHASGKYSRHVLLEATCKDPA